MIAAGKRLVTEQDKWDALVEMQDTAGWRYMQETIQQWLECDRISLEAPALDPIETEHYRGRISVIREILNLARVKEEQYAKRV